MSRGGTAKYVHLLGALSFAGWAFLAVASHRVQRPLTLFLVTLALEWALFLVAWALVAGNKRNSLAILAWVPAFLLCGFLGQPVMEDDHFRFLWDGRQFATTGNPYAAPPAAWFRDPQLPERFQQILDNISYPHVATVYGPVCQMGFLISYWIAPGQLWAWKLFLLVAELALLRIVIALAARQENQLEIGRQTVFQSAFLMGWCPLLIFESGFNAHPDILAIMLLAAALLCRSRRQYLACGILCGLACASRVLALVLAPFLLARSPKPWLAFAGAFLAAYVPFWLQASNADWGGLTIFAREWEFNSSVYALVRWALGISMAKIICGLLFACVWLLLFRRWLARLENRVPIASVPPGGAIYGGLLLFSATVNPWYVLWLAPFVALRPTAAGIAAMVLVSLSYVTGLNVGQSGLGNFEHPVWVRPAEYGGVALVALADWWYWRGKTQPSATL